MAQNQMDITSTVKALMGVAGVCFALKKASQAYLDAQGTSKEEDALKSLLGEAKSDVSSVDDLLKYFTSSDAISAFGKEGAAQHESHAKDLKAHGEKYCDCQACTLARQLLKMHGEEMA